MSISLIILFTPIVAYLAAGTLKFVINSIYDRSLSLSKIGMGGFPSTHNTITSVSYTHLTLPTICSL